jgi:glycosyltransferase involved in cell wall biosynthesis
MKPRVAILLSGYGVVQRGAEIMLDQLLPRLEDRFELHVYSRSGRGPGGRCGKAVPRTAMERVYLATRLGRKALDTLFLDPIHVEWTSHLLSCWPSLVRERYDVIWHETGFWGGLLLAMLRRRTGVRLLDIGHSNYPGWELPFARRRPDIYVALNQEFAALVRSQVPGQRVEVVPQGVDCDLFRPEVEPLALDLQHPLVLVAGALSPEKEPDLALESVARTDASLIFAGGGPLAERLDRRARQLLPPGRYRRMLLPRSEMPRLYAAVDLVMMTSPRESAPLVPLEAMASGRPVVAAADAARREMVGPAGILVPRQDADAYAEAIRQALARDWQSIPRRRALEFSLDASAERLGDLLADLARSGR